jgi:hypothetical protein
MTYVLGNLLKVTVLEKEIFLILSVFAILTVFAFGSFFHFFSAANRSRFLSTFRHLLFLQLFAKVQTNFSNI